MSFSIDGKSWDDFRRSSLDYNPNYFSDTLLGGYRPRARLYDYSYGQVRDAAEKLGIKNINKSREEFKILDLIRNPQAKDPAPAPVPAPAPATAAPQATLRVQAPTTPQVSTDESANQVAALQKSLDDAIASFQAQMGQQTQSYQKQLADYQTQAQQQFQTYQQQSQAQLTAAQQQAEESQRQMMIGLAQRNRAPAEVKMAQSGGAQRGLTRRGTTGYFGRQGMRIGSLNVPTSGLTISTDAAGRAASGSFM